MQKGILSIHLRKAARAILQPLKKIQIFYEKTIPFIHGARGHPSLRLHDLLRDRTST
jgi:hypothetical protein